MRYSDIVIGFFSKERFTVATSIIRIIFGIIILYQYTILYSQRHFLFTNYGYHTFNDNSISLYNISDSLIHFDIVYHLGIVITIIFTLGIRGRISSILNFIFYYSLYLRFNHIGDGGDNLMIIVLFLLLFANCTRYFSFDKNNPKKERSLYFSKLSSIIHNFSVFFILAQVILLYMISATYQLMGETWSSGTALYYISQVETMSSPLFEKFATGSFVYFGVLFTYASIFVKYAFIFLIFNKRTKIFAVTSICLFHVGIAFGMQLYTFSLVMIAVETLFFTNNEYYSFYRKVIRTSTKLKKSLLLATRNLSKKHLQKQKIVVSYDGWCRSSLFTVSKLRRLDWLELLVLTNFRESGSSQDRGLDLNELEKHIFCITIKNNKVQNGIGSFIELSKRTIPLWIFVPLLYFSKWIGVGNVVYDVIAKRRDIVPTNKCFEEVYKIEKNRVAK